jgi:2-(1,2-epoxy-1,2-dihydrophenyl)acetyl-CoA isomerase
MSTDKSAEQRVEITRRGSIVRLTLARPARKNAIDLQTTEELARAARALETDDSVRVIILTGSGDAFSVGGDIDEFVAQQGRLREHLLAMTSALHAAIVSLRKAPAPLLVAVNGVAAGGGFSLVAAADLAIAKRSAQLVSAFTRSGLTPDSGATWFLPRRIGYARAFDLLATNRKLTADQAEAIGLVARVVDDEAFDAAVDEAADALAGLPSAAASGVKKLLGGDDVRELTAHLAREADSIATIATSPETLAKLAAFVRR